MGNDRSRHGGQWPTHKHKARMKSARARWAARVRRLKAQA